MCMLLPRTGARLARLVGPDPCAEQESRSVDADDERAPAATEIKYLKKVKRFHTCM